MQRREYLVLHIGRHSLRSRERSHDLERASSSDRDKGDRRSRDCDRYSDRDCGYDRGDRERSRSYDAKSRRRSRERSRDYGRDYDRSRCSYTGKKQKNTNAEAVNAYVIMSPVFLLHFTHKVSSQIAAA